MQYFVTPFTMKVTSSPHCVTSSIFHGVENDFPYLWRTGIYDAILPVSYSEYYYQELANSINFRKICKILEILARKFSRNYFVIIQYFVGTVNCLCPNFYHHLNNIFCKKKKYFYICT